MKHSIVCVAGAFLLCASPAFAQGLQPPDPDRVRVRLGPLWINPTFALANAGVDSNVFNDSDDTGPKRDFTMTLSPGSNLWLRMGPTWIAGAVREDIVWYKKFASERSANNRYSVAWLVPLTRLVFSVGGAWMNGRERPGFEIDSRPRRNEKELNGAAEVRAFPKTLFGVRGARRRTDFAEGARFLGTDLRTELTRTNTGGALTIRHELTPLTALTLDVGEEHDRFEFSPLRDSDSRRIDVGLRFDPFALISGTARFGFRNFKPLAGDVPGYSGTTAMVNLSYVARGSTRLAVQATRDVEYSFDNNQPYYLQSGISGSIAQQIYGPVDVEARAGAQKLSYRARAGAAGVPVDRADHVRTYGLGAGYRVGPDFRLGFNVDQQDRTSVLEQREYSGLRYGVAVTYGF